MKKKVQRQHVIFDTEIIGMKKPVFLIGCKIIETGQVHAFWLHKRGHLEAFEAMLASPNYTWVGFNSEHFDRPLISAALSGYKADSIKSIATSIVQGGLKSWQTYREFDLEYFEYDHIDLFDVAPGVMTSLKTYGGRIAYPTMVDMPIHHDHDCNAKEQKIIESYCLNDLGVTEALYLRLKDECAIRVEMSKEYNLDLRSKSDAQVAEAILKKRVGIAGGKKDIPPYVTYTAPDIIKTKNKAIIDLVSQLENHSFKINFGNGSPVAPTFLDEPLTINKGTYKCGIGGLHSTHDLGVHYEATETMLLSDFDAASYYPNIMMKAGLIPRLAGNKGERFLAEYKAIYDLRVAAKRSGNKKLANMLKIVLNGTFGKLGSMFCCFYAPDLMLGVTITGQLNLLCLIDEIEKTGATVVSANTDGIMVYYHKNKRAKVLKALTDNAKRTGFEYEETPYRKVGMKDVNNYLAIPLDRPAVIISDKSTVKVRPKLDVKGKGLYAEKGLMKNPTMQVCVSLVVDYMTSGVLPENSISKYTDMEDYVAIRNVKGGGIQYDSYRLVDDWVEVEQGVWRRPRWPALKAPVRRKSRPAPVEVGVGGTQFGRVARWYMTTQALPPLSYLSSGNQVPKTEGAKVCMTLPKSLPKDLDKSWYINEAYEILAAIGLPIRNDSDRV